MPNSKINCGSSSSGKLYSIDLQLRYLCFETIYQSHFQGSSRPSTIISTPKRPTTNLIVREQEGQNPSNSRVFTLKHYISAIPWARTHLFSKFQGVLGNETATRLNPLNTELNPICYLLALLGAHHFLHVSRIRVKSLTLRQLMLYIYIYICVCVWSTYSWCF